MPTSKHRKKHKAKVKQRKTGIVQAKNAHNRKMQKFQEQINAMIEEQKKFVAAGGKPEDFNPQFMPTEDGDMKIAYNNPETIEDAIIVEDEQPQESVSIDPNN